MPGGGGENLAAAALEAFRAATGWDAAPMRLPSPSGSPWRRAWAAARPTPPPPCAWPGPHPGSATMRLLRVAAALGADVPASSPPGRWLATGAGEVLQALAPPAWPFGVLILPLAAALSTAQVYGEADRLFPRPRAAGARRARRGMLSALGTGTPLPQQPALLANDLQRAAISLCPQIEPALEEARAAGADHVLLSGSGPTVLGLFSGRAGRGREGPMRAHKAAQALAARAPEPLSAEPVLADYGAPAPVQGGPGALSGGL